MNGEGSVGGCLWGFYAFNCSAVRFLWCSMRLHTSPNQKRISQVIYELEMRINQMILLYACKKYKSHFCKHFLLSLKFAPLRIPGTDQTHEVLKLKHQSHKTRIIYWPILKAWPDNSIRNPLFYNVPLLPSLYFIHPFAFEESNYSLWDKKE